MSVEELQAYAKFCRSGWKELIRHEESGIGPVCVLVCKFFMHSGIVFLLLDLDTYHCIVRNN
jgi:hypothetical protein